MVNSAVIAENLWVDRGEQSVLHDVNFTLTQGGITGLLGPSGSGKTTLLRAIVGVQQITQGTISVFGKSAGDPALRSKIGYATQNPALYADLTVIENLRYFSAVLGAPSSDVDRVIAKVDLNRDAHKLVVNLSGGQRGRANLAVALLGKPELLVLDEPTVGLDPVLRDELWTLFRRLTTEGTTLLVSSHVMDEAARCDRLLLLREGNILADETPQELRARTGTEDLEQAFLRLVLTAKKNCC